MEDSKYSEKITDRNSFFAVKKNADYGNSVEAQFLVAECFEQGKWVSKSLKKAIKYYKKAADQGHSNSQVALASLYKNGLGVDLDFDQAFHYAKKAADKGNSSGLVLLGNLYAEGKGVEKSAEMAFKYYQRASDIALNKIMSEPFYYLANCYENGVGTEISWDKAIYYYKLAGENGLMEAYCKMSSCFRKLGGEENEKKAIAYQRIFEESKKIESEEKIKTMKVKHGFKQGLEKIFFIKKESIKHLLDGQDNVELILDFRKNDLLSDNFLEAVQEDRCGFCKKDNSLSFPKEHLDLIIKRYREGKIKSVIFIKVGGQTVIDVNDIDFGIEVEEEKTYQDSFILDNKYVNVFCEITESFPGLEKNERAYLVYLPSKSSPFNDSSTKVMMMNHFTPWNMDQQLFEELLKLQKIGVYVKSPEKGTAIHLTEKCAKKLVKENVKALFYSKYVKPEVAQDIEDENLRNMLLESPEQGASCIYPHERGIYVFSEAQYEVVKKIAASIVKYKNLLGKENLLVGGMFSTHDEKLYTDFSTLSLKREGQATMLVFYLDKIDQNYFSIKCIDRDTVKSVGHWKKIVEEERLLVILNKDKRKHIIIKKEYFEKNPLLNELMNDTIFPIIIDVNDKFVFKGFFNSYEFSTEDDYKKLLEYITPFVEEFFDQKK